jgi:hypothetical protein
LFVLLVQVLLHIHSLHSSIHILYSPAIYILVNQWYIPSRQIYPTTLVVVGILVSISGWWDKLQDIHSPDEDNHGQLLPVVFWFYSWITRSPSVTSLLAKSISYSDCSRKRKEEYGYNMIYQSNIYYYTSSCSTPVSNICPQLVLSTIIC